MVCAALHRQRERNRRATADEKRKRVARESINKAVKFGRIVRPAACQQCGATGDVEAHHPDYRRFRDVEWLCPGCHGKTRRTA